MARDYSSSTEIELTQGVNRLNVRVSSKNSHSCPNRHECPAFSAIETGVFDIKRDECERSITGECLLETVRTCPQLQVFHGVHGDSTIRTDYANH